MALSALGIASVSVRARPRVAIICSGKEIVNGSINNSNGPYLQAFLKESHVLLQSYHVIDDTPSEFEVLFQKILQDQPDMILTTGGVSAGRWDFIPDSLQKMGMTLHFHKLSIQPAKPVLCGSVGATWILGLPGNPISVAVAARFFVLPLLRQLQGLPQEQPSYASLSTPVQKKPGFRVFFRGRKTTTASGQIEVEVFKEQQSFKIRPLLDANCWIVLDETKNEYQPKDQVPTYEL
jgi:molybdopterin molybdotransferase